jgi:hypothetical protein
MRKRFLHYDAGPGISDVTHMTELDSEFLDFLDSAPPTSTFYHISMHCTQHDARV